MSLFVLASKDGWVNIMYHGLDAVGVDQQVFARQLNKNDYHVAILDDSLKNYFVFMLFNYIMVSLLTFFLSFFSYHIFLH